VKHAFAFPALLVFLLLGCLTPVAGGTSGIPGPQLQLPKATLVLGTNSLVAQVAADDSTREVGFMSRSSLGRDEAMLFIFPKARPVSFWMKNTQVPLSVAYLGTSGRILEIHDLKPLDETPVPSASSAVLYALEVPQGWFLSHGVLSGDNVRGLPSPASAK
jgi:uncharacterized membrane protein (UPF0127 family)